MARVSDAKEIDIQAAIVEWLRRCIRCHVAAIPNGGKRGFAAARQAKREGMSAGAPDLVVAYHDGTEARTLWIEVKSRTGRLSDDQERWQEALRELGHDYIVARSLDDVINWFSGE